MDDDFFFKKLSNKVVIVYGILFVIVVLVIVLFDNFVVVFLGRKWFKLYVVIGSIYFLFILGVMVFGFVISG